MELARASLRQRHRHRSPGLSQPLLQTDFIYRESPGMTVKARKASVFQFPGFRASEVGCWPVAPASRSETDQ